VVNVARAQGDSSGIADLDKEKALSDAYAALDSGDSETAWAMADSLLATLTDMDLRFEARALACMAHCDRLGSRPRRACEGARRAAQIFEQLGDTQGEASALTTLAHASILLGRSEEAFEAAILSTLLSEIGPPSAQTVLAYNCLGLAHCWSGDYDRADAAFEKAVVVAQTCVPPVTIYQPRLNQIWVELARLVDERYQTGQMKSLARLDRRMKECLALERGGQGVSVLPGVLALWRTLSNASATILAVWQGDLRAAKESLAAANRSLSTNVTWLHGFVHWCNAELAWAQGDWARVESELAAMREVALAVEHERLACMADLLLVPVYELQNKDSAIRVTYRRLRERERRIVTEGLASRESLVSWRLDARQSERHLQQALAASKKFEQWSLEDALTGIANRRHFEQSLAGRIAASALLYRPITVAMVDVDRFKLVNDRFTHSVGDRVLKTVASIMAGEMRQYDLPARWAGDEFVVLFDNTTVEQAEQICTRIREAVSNFHWASIAPGLQMSVSIGVSQVQPDDTAESVLHRSDEAMYLTKSANATV
jgi:diguanylate cyclase (GGDEF)-like protein